MVPRLPAVVVLACLTVLAGCGGFFGSDPSQTATPSVTAAPVPTNTPTPDHSSVRDVPGLSADGVENPFVLARAHRAVLSNLSYTQRTNETTRFLNGSLRLRSTSVNRVVPTNGTPRFLRVTTYEGPVSPVFRPYPTATRVETYADDRAHIRFTFPNGTTSVLSFNRTGGRSSSLELTFAAFETRIAGTTACGSHTCYRVRSTALDTPAYLADTLRLREASRVQNGSLVALVDDRGLVRENRVRYTVETPPRTYTGVRHIRYTALGETTVGAPDWVNVQAT
jgi:hypothetical protein